MDAEIMQVLLDEAREAYDEEIVVELRSDELADLDGNVERIQQWAEKWKEDRMGEDEDGLSARKRRRGEAIAESTETTFVAGAKTAGEGAIQGEAGATGERAGADVGGGGGDLGLEAARRRSFLCLRAGGVEKEEGTIVPALAAWRRVATILKTQETKRQAR